MEIVCGLAKENRWEAGPTHPLHRRWRRGCVLPMMNHSSRVAAIVPFGWRQFEFRFYRMGNLRMHRRTVGFIYYEEQLLVNRGL